MVCLMAGMSQRPRGMKSGSENAWRFVIDRQVEVIDFEGIKDVEDQEEERHLPYDRRVPQDGLQGDGFSWVVVSDELC